MVTDDGWTGQADMEGSTRFGDLWSLSPLLKAGFGGTSESAADVGAVGGAGRHEVTGGRVAGHGVNGEIDRTHRIYGGGETVRTDRKN